MRVNNTLRHEVTHQEAREAIRTALAVYCRKFPQYQPTTAWLDENKAHTSFRYKHFSLVAEVEVLGDRIEMGMDVPLLFWPFKTAALALIENEIRKWLARAKAGELRPPSG